MRRQHIISVFSIAGIRLDVNQLNPILYFMQQCHKSIGKQVDFDQK